jgi:outer membrane protein OmpA-like peptidoglycan-associated protein
LIIIQVPSLCDDSDNISPTYIGWVNYQLNKSEASFSALPGVPNCCPSFKLGSGTGYSIGVDMEFVLPANFKTGIGLGIFDRSHLMKANEYTFVKVNNSVEKAKIEHQLHAKLNDLSFFPYISYRIFDNLYLKIGVTIGLMFNGTFHQVEQIIEPTDRGVFVNTGTRKRNDTSGILPQMSSVYSAFNPEIYYDFKLNSNSSWKFSVALSYSYGLTDIIQNLDWKVNSFAFGLKIKYSPPANKIETKEENQYHYKFDTITVLSEDYVKNTVKNGNEITKTSIERIGNVITTNYHIFRRDTLFKRPYPRVNLSLNSDKINLLGQFVTQAFPLVPVVFFDMNSNDIPELYYQNVIKENFHPDSLRVETMNYQRHLLNIIGQRLDSYPNAKIFISGYCDSTTETNINSLSKLRALKVKEYLVNKWKISENRLVINESDKIYPSEPTSTKNDSGYSENRRVEISSDNPEILTPIKNKRFVEPKIINPPVITMKTDGSTTKGIVSWSLKLMKSGKVISYKEGRDAPLLIDDTIQVSNFNTLFSNEPIDLTYELTDSEGQTSIFKQSIPINADTVEYEIQRLSLILFGVATAELSEKAKNDVRNFLDRIHPNSIIRITGYTDVLGSYSYNQKLSALRAENTASLVRNLLPSARIEYVRGEASKYFPPGIFSYSSPIERFLSRTVFIELLNKIK